MFTSSFFPLILRPTRITQHTATLIDNIFTNDIENIEDSTNGILFCDISAHLPHSSCRHQQNNLFTKECNTIKNMSWENVLSSNNSTESYNEFFHLFSPIYESNFPLTKNLKKRKIDKKKSPWMTKCIAKSVIKKNKLYKKYLHHPTANNENKYEHHVIKRAKTKYYR